MPLFIPAAVTLEAIHLPRLQAPVAGGYLLKQRAAGQPVDSRNARGGDVVVLDDVSEDVLVGESPDGSIAHSTGVVAHSEFAKKGLIGEFRRCHRSYVAIRVLGEFGVYD